jgi:hypothetical protein
VGGRFVQVVSDLLPLFFNLCPGSSTLVMDETDEALIARCSPCNMAATTMAATVLHGDTLGRLVTCGILISTVLVRRFSNDTGDDDRTVLFSWLMVKVATDHNVTACAGQPCLTSALSKHNVQQRTNAAIYRTLY